MGNRLSKIYTRTGDQGTTGLGDGDRVTKDDVRVEAYGTVDELNSSIGLILANSFRHEKIRETLIEVQHDLFDLGGELCIPGISLIKPESTALLENVLDELNKDLPALKDFILPGGGENAARTHLARTICRRAERRVWTLIIKVQLEEGEDTDKVNLEGAKYLNRLSDLLFVIARIFAREDKGQEVLWKRGKAQKES